LFRALLLWNLRLMPVKHWTDCHQERGRLIKCWRLERINEKCLMENRPGQLQSRGSHTKEIINHTTQPAYWAAYSYLARTSFLILADDTLYSIVWFPLIPGNSLKHSSHVWVRSNQLSLTGHSDGYCSKASPWRMCVWGLDFPETLTWSLFL